MNAVDSIGSQWKSCDILCNNTDEYLPYPTTFISDYSVILMPCIVSAFDTVIRSSRRSSS